MRMAFLEQIVLNAKLRIMFYMIAVALYGVLATKRGA